MSSPEVESIVRQIYATKLLPEQSNRSELIRAEFSTLLSCWLSDSQQDSIIFTFVDELFNSLLQGCEQALQVAINRGVLAAHEAKSVVRFHMLHDELAAIQKNLDFLLGQQQRNIPKILEFEQRYRQQIPSRHGYITPPNFDTSRKLPIDRLYICPNFIRTSRKKDEKEVLKINEFCSVIYRAILLGNPGGGKSTLTDKLCNDLATHYSSRLLAGRQATPIHVILRDYGAAKKERNCSILEFIHATAVSKYQLTSPPAETFEYLLLNGRAVVIFDGLDELLDTSYRQTISGDVESFCSLYPSVPVLVTSRDVGYREAPLDEEKFEIFRLGSFDDGQVKEYVNNWFLATESELEIEQHDRKVEAFLHESKVVPDLRSNPLMLALLCNIYRGEGYIPRNRPDIYEKCAVMLFERWDRSRGIQVSLPFESRIIFAMMYLAHWIYTNETLQGGVTEQELVTKATDYLCQRQYEDRDEAEKAAYEFIEFCRGRAWVFTDTGTMKEGERLYQFTHRTFLEYFTASHLVRQSRNPENLQEILLSKISKREWDVVAQLAFRIQDKQTEEAGDELLAAVIQKSHKTQGSEKWNLLSFAARCLEFIVPSPVVRRNIVAVCVDFCLKQGLEQIRHKQIISEEFYCVELEDKQLVTDEVNDFDVNQPVGALIHELLTCVIENRAIIADGLRREIIESINDQDETISLIASEIGLYFRIPLVFSDSASRNVQKEDIEFWNNTSNSIFEACSERIQSLSSKDYQICLYCFNKEKVSVSQLVSWYGISCIFKSTPYTIFSNVHTLPLAELILHDIFFAIPTIEKQNRSISHLNELGQIFISSSTPIIIKVNRSHVSPNFLKIIDERFSDNYQDLNSSKLSPDALFATFIIFAVFLEIHLEERDLLEDNRKSKILSKLEKNSHFLINYLRYTFLSRFKPVRMNKMQTELKHSNLTEIHKEFIGKWVRREIDLVVIKKGKSRRRK